jgi:hypothetical protein
MSEIRTNEVFMAGRMSRGPVQTKDGYVHFLFEAARDREPFHCVCDGKTAENLLTHCQVGDEFSIEGELRWMNFPNTGKTLVIHARYTSYGRKLRTLRQIPGD